MSYAGCICVSPYDPIQIVICKQDRSGRTGRIDREGEGAVAITEIAVSDSGGIYIITNGLL